MNETPADPPPALKWVMRRCCTCDAVDQQMITPSKPLLCFLDAIQQTCRRRKKIQSARESINDCPSPIIRLPFGLALRREVLKAGKKNRNDQHSRNHAADCWFSAIFRRNPQTVRCVALGRPSSSSSATAPFSLPFHLKLPRAVVQQSSATPSSARTLLSLKELPCCTCNVRLFMHRPQRFAGRWQQNQPPLSPSLFRFIYGHFGDCLHIPHVPFGCRWLSLSPCLGRHRRDLLSTCSKGFLIHCLRHLFPASFQKKRISFWKFFALSLSPLHQLLLLLLLGGDSLSSSLSPV